ncbi:hypothetical protein HID58_038093 [Brassica napus]|uniref:Uncharacterized protein n=1 Tax=Brassica napus TaxID=3708 RepID=A0ABQ8BN59_BRANA|nr:hypothetical protein HID58_038093 [Brassica napus]
MTVRSQRRARKATHNSQSINYEVDDNLMEEEEEENLMETETQKAANVNEGKERQDNKKKLGKPCGAVMGGTLKKRLVQSVVSPRKKHTAKQGSKMGGEGGLAFMLRTITYEVGGYGTEQ